MRQIEHRGCNGWAIYDKEYIAGEQPHNIHVVEATVSKNSNGVVTSCPNLERKTQCGNQQLIAGKRCCIFASEFQVEIRKKLAELQNQGYEVCGQCVATFYSDGC